MTDLMTQPVSNTGDPWIQFQAAGVTGSETLEVRFQRSTPAGAVAHSLAEMLGMPDDVPWALRDDGSSAYLEDRAIGDQIDPGAQVTLTPKTHLG